MTAYVFAGPSLPHDEVLLRLDAVCLPPVAQGDIYRAALSRPRVIGIIDGYFEGVPSVWHKEILWAMSQGIHVFGGASMGALRAAELCDFGMEGVGRIFAAFRAGVLEDDDEVAVLHGPPETGYASLSEPLVNIRFTLERAQNERIVAPATRGALEHLGKALFYPDRSWERLFSQARERNLPEEEIAALKSWLSKGRVDQKREDALAMLAAMGDLLKAGHGPKRTSYRFEWTELWDKTTGFPSHSPTGGQQSSLSAPRERILDELRLEGNAFQEAQQGALLRLLALREADRQGLGADAAALKRTAARFRAERDLFRRQDLERWIGENEIDIEGLEGVLEEEARLTAVKTLARPQLGGHVLAQLRLSGDYPRLAERARRKVEVLAAAGLEDPEPGAVGPMPASLLAWFFESKLGCPIPETPDEAARQYGFQDRQDLYRVLLREYLYLSYNEDAAPPDNSKERD
jgi:hypothetical protein